MAKPSLDEIFGGTSTVQKPSLDDIFSGKTPQGESGDDWLSKSFPKTARNNLSKLYQGGGNSPALKKAQYDVESDKSRTNPVMTTLKGLSDTADQINKVLPFGDRKQTLNPTTPQGRANIAGESLKAASFIPGVGVGVGAAAYGAGMAVEDQKKSVGGAALETGLYGAGGALLKPAIKFGGQAIKAVSKFIPETIKRGAADYLTKDVTGKVTKIFQDAVTKFTPEIVNFSRKIGIPESAISTMKKYGTQAVEQLKGSGDALYQRITKGLETKDKEVSDAYAKAFQGKDDLTIPIPKSASAMKELLLKAKYIDKDGNITEYAKNDITENSALRKILNFYKSSLPEKLPDSGILDATGKPIPADPSTKQFEGTNGFQWRTFRDELSKLRRSNKGLSREISKISDAMHSDAENAGFKGLSNARDLARKNFEAEDKFMTNTDNVKALFGENGVGKYHTMTGEQKRSVQELSKYIGDNNLVSDIEKHSASKYLDKIMEGKSEDNFRTLIQQAYKDKDYMSVTEKKLSDLIGYKNAKEVMKEISTKRNIENVKKGAKYVGGTAAGLAGADAIYETGKKVFGG